MTANAIVRARIDEHIKEEASVVLASMGLTVSDAFRMLLTRVAKDKSLPFEPLVPNQKTIDELLDKISKNGYENLSKTEKELLFKLSQKK